MQNKLIKGVLGVQESSKSDFKEEIMECFGHHLLDWQFFLQHPLPPRTQLPTNKLNKFELIVCELEQIVCESCVFVICVVVLSN